MIIKIKNTVSWMYLVENLNGEKKFWTVLWKNIIKTNQIEFRIEKIRKKKGDESYVKLKG